MSFSPQVIPPDYSWRYIDPPATEPVTLAAAKLQCRVDASLTEEDDLITECIQGARDYIEKAFSLALVVQRREILFQQFPREDRIRLPIWPVQSVDYLRYTDSAGVTHDLPYGAATDAANVVRTRLARKPCELVLGFNKIWPAAILDTADAIQVGVTCGYVKGTSPETLPFPAAVTRAMKLLIAHGYDNRAAVTMGTLLKSDPLAIGVAALMANERLY